MFYRTRALSVALVGLALGVGAPALAEEATVEAETSRRLQDLEAEVARLQDRIEEQRRALAEVENEVDELDDEGGFRELGIQLQLRFEYSVLAHNRRNDIFAGGGVRGSRERAQTGLAAGVGLRLPLWINIFEKIDLMGLLDITYRQNDRGSTYVSPVTGERGTTSYANIIAGPLVRIRMTEMLRPFVFFGGNLQAQSPPTDGVTYLDAGFAFGGGIDVRLFKKLSVGIDARWTCFGTGDQEDSDYGAAGVYVGFNF